MQIKTNESTPQRPEGDRIIDAPLVKIDLPEFMAQIKQEPTWKDSDRNAITVFKTDTVRIILMALHKDAVMATHKAPGVICVQVLEGEILFTIADNTTQLSKGQMLTLHAGMPHSVIAKEESIFMLTLCLEKKLSGE